MLVHPHTYDVYGYDSRAMCMYVPDTVDNLENNLGRSRSKGNSNNNNTTQCDPAYAGSGEIRMQAVLPLQVSLLTKRPISKVTHKKLRESLL